MIQLHAVWKGLTSNTTTWRLTEKWEKKGISCLELLKNNNSKTGVTILKAINMDSEQGILLEKKRDID